MRRGIWESGSGVIYQFNQGTGVLSVSVVPEASQIVAFGLIAMASAGWKLSRKRQA
jgi:hypothetical protein